MNALEIACFNVESAIIASNNKVDRIEFCAEMHLGGITPIYADIEETRNIVPQDLYVMIRPRGGDFNYSKEEFSQMKLDISSIKSMQVDGFVFGVFNDHKEIDIERNKELVAMAYPLPCTFHRAFDETKDMYQALEDVISCGFHTILTSGHCKNVIEGLTNLSLLIEKANDRISIMPGGGLRSSNIETVMNQTKAKYYHSSAIVGEDVIPDVTEIFAMKSILN